MSTYLQDKRDEEGFTLIELLVVVIIIGILAAIAIPVFLSQREKAWDAAAQSTLRSAAVAQESFFTENGIYTRDPDELGEFGFPVSGDVEVTVITPTASEVAPAAFCVSAKHEAPGATTWYVANGGAPASTTDCTP